MSEPTLDERFTELRRSVDGEIARARCELIAELTRVVSRMRSASTDSELKVAITESNGLLADNPSARELLAAIAEWISPTLRKTVPGIEAGARAQRFARVKVAEIQLYQAPAVKAGREARNLYGWLRPHIDAAREAFRERFLTPGQGIDDYLHAELVRELANDDATLLGPGYPGPMA